MISSTYEFNLDRRMPDEVLYTFDYSNVPL